MSVGISQDFLQHLVVFIAGSLDSLLFTKKGRWYISIYLLWYRDNTSIYLLLYMDIYLLNANHERGQPYNLSCFVIFNIIQTLYFISHSIW